jgi:large subunit ribosomal protein L4
MAVAKKFNDNGEGQAELALPDILFDVEISNQALYESVKHYLANQRQGTAKTKERGEVAYSTAKLYRQKGTGRARAGSAKSPIRTGGGTIFGPKPRDHRMSVNKKVRRLALLSAMTDRARESAVSVVEGLQMDAPKTKHAARVIGNMGLQDKKVLFVVSDQDEALFKSMRNIEGVDVIRARVHRCLARASDGGVRRMKDLTRVIVRPVVTEKTTDMGENDKYVFEVASEANKAEVKQAVEKFFGVKVVDVHTLNMKGKPKRLGRHMGRRKDWKKAIVTVQSGDKIDLFDVV